MGKKSRNDIPNPSSVSNRDVIQRLNFLYQASVYLDNVQSSSTTPSHDDSSSRKFKDKQNKRKKVVKLKDLSRSYIETMKSVGTKTTVQLDPSVKRTLCKGCNTVLVPGSTASMRTKKSSTHGHSMVYTCTSCEYVYRIPAAPILRPGEGSVASKAVAMDVDVPQTQTEVQSTSQVDVSQEQQHPRTRKKQSIPPRLPPLYARDAGHVVFAGNEQLPTSNGSWNDGIFIT
ncbi:RNAse P Rpr2/Rpp21/SNM1 subunit domain-containing protein [Lentinula aciculospora]|uniref:RNAse P Rpr2/Rpp21/SNM1 subunit domain-containing protein n=1 Tax=Lentinula aciculospora TaxID=153920 RepID=A0A9W9AJ62_9AGAR|nr:RNAse P Rpr2/Rpp21/SNM1 subunit domain-containing protein [Lentinula aciculospora]